MRNYILLLFACLALVATSVSAASYDVAAYVWPAYHPAPRWAELGIFKAGKGEWQSVWEAVPKWEGHDQPRKPVWGYTNEADPKDVAQKIDAAVSYGVNVFIYDWYWYGGRPFLEDALDKGFLGAPNNGKMKFFIMWANHNVGPNWDNTRADKSGQIWSGEVSFDEFKTLVARWIDLYFRRPNYYRIQDRPVVMLYDLPNFIHGLGGVEKAREAIAYLKRTCQAAGLNGAHVMACDFGLDGLPVKYMGFDSATIYNFVHWSSPAEQPDYDAWTRRAEGRYPLALERLKLPAYFPHASVGWDQNPRYPKTRTTSTVTNSTPAKFEAALRRAKDWADRNVPAGYPKLITVNSWNEWTEGSYLEPDEKNGFGYLEAVKRVFKQPRYEVLVPVGGNRTVPEALPCEFDSVKKLDSSRIVFVAGVMERNDKKRAEVVERTRLNVLDAKKAGFTETAAWFWSFWCSDTKGLTTMTASDGWTSGNICCPLDPGFRNIAGIMVRDFARTGVDMILLDDDFRYGNYHDEALVCTCARHMARVEAKLGEKISPQDLLKKSMKGGRNRYRDAWMDANGEAFRDYAAYLRACVDEVNPKVRLGLCACMSHWDHDGVDAATTARILAGTTRPFLRLIAAPYWASPGGPHYYGGNLQNVIEFARMERTWVKGDDIEVVGEGDTYPRPRWTTSSSYLELFDLALRADGRFNGILKYAVDYDNPLREGGYVARHMKNRPLHEEVARRFDGRTAVGVRIYEERDRLRDAVLEGDLAGNMRFVETFGSAAAKCCSDLAIPTVWEGEGLVGMAFGENVRHVPAEARRRGLVIDAWAARILMAQGVDVGIKAWGRKMRTGAEVVADGLLDTTAAYEAYDVTLAEGAEVVGPKTPGRPPYAFLYRNAAGEKYLVLPLEAYWTQPGWHRTYEAGRLLAEGIQRLAGKPLPAFLAGNPDVMLMAKDGLDGSRTVAVFNCFADALVDAPIELDRAFKKVEFVNCRGRLEGNRVILDEVPAYAFAAFTVYPSCATSPVAGASSLEKWFSSEARSAVAGCAHRTAEGLTAYAPDSSGHYKAAWLRDFTMMLEGDAVPHEHIVPNVLRFVAGVSPEGNGVDCIKAEGTCIYKPGYGTMGANAVVDGAPYTVDCVYLGWKLTGDRRLVATNVVDTLERALSAVPCDVATGLVWIDPSVAWDRCAWGFTDTVRKSGCCLMESLLLAEACERLAEIEDAIGRVDDAQRNRERVSRIVRKMDEVFWDASRGLYRAATVRNREHDVWASTFAVWKGYAPAEHADVIARNFRDRYGDFVQNGQVRHLPVGEYWEQACARDTYQNGGYWGTPTGWFAWTLARVDAERALQMLGDLRTAYERTGAVEWSLGNVRSKASPYPASLTLPLAAIRRLLSGDGKTSFTVSP